MTRKYVQDGYSVDHAAGGAISSGDVVVLQNIIGVATGDIASGETGAVRVDGVFSLPKVSATAWVQGDVLDWDASAGAFTKAIATPAVGDITKCAIAAADAASADTEAAVLLRAIPGTIN